MNAEHDDLASAYLDGELTAEERRIAQADPAVMAEVAQLRALRARLADIAAPTDAVREASIAAALDVFAGLHTPKPAAVASRDRQMRWLGVAAAVLIIGLLGVVVAIGVGGSEGDDAADEPLAEDAAEVPIEMAAEEPAAEEPAEAPADEAADLLSDADASAEIATLDDAAGEAAEEPASEPAEEPAEEPASEPTAGDTDGTSAPSTNARTHLDGEPMTAPEQLAAVGRHLLDLVAARELPPTPEHSCAFSDVLASGYYADEAPTPNPPIEVLIAVDTERDRVIAIARATCHVVVETPLP